MRTGALHQLQERFSARPASAEYIRALIGNTPMLAVYCHYRGKRRTIFAKAEHLNLTGSIKDRMALHILSTARDAGELKPGGTIAEATSGNTGISFAALGDAFGNRVRIFMPDWMSKERIALIRSYGAEIKLVSHEEGGFKGAIAQAEQFASENGNAFLPRQFSNTANSDAHYLTTGPEISQQLEQAGLTADAFVAGVGTGGTIMGCGRYLRERQSLTKVHPLEPAESPTLSTGHKVGTHRIQGISDEFIPALCRLDELDEVIQVSDGDSILMAQLMAQKLGLAVGISSGANLIGALMVAERLGDDAVVATVFPDDNKKYLSTDLIREEPVKTGFFTPDVELFGYHTLAPEL